MVGNVFLKPISRLLKLTRKEGKVISYGGNRAFSSMQCMVKSLTSKLMYE